MRTLSATALASANAPQTGEAWLVLLTLDHASLAAPIRVVNNTEDIESNGETFVAFPFDIELPGQDPEQPLGSRLRIDNIDRTVINALRSISGPPTARIDVILASLPDDPEITFEGLTLRNASYDAGTVSGDLAFEQILTEPVATTLSPSKFPGLF